VKTEKTTIFKVKHKSNQPQLSKENFKKPQTFQGMYMLESVQVFMHWGRRMIRKLDHLPDRSWETQAAPKAPSFLQLSNHGWMPHRRANVLRKLNKKPRNKIAVLEMNVHLHPSMSFPHQGRSSWYLSFFQLRKSLNLNLFLGDHSLLPQ
jgi:hypothetical protein